MNFGPQRGHIAGIFDSFFKDFGLLIVAIVIALIQGDMDIVLENLGVLIIVLLGPVLRIVGHLTTTYEVDAEKLMIRSGVFTKNSLEIPLSTITTVDFSQNIFHQIFGVYRLNIDNNSNISNDETKVHMTLSKADADQVKSLLMKGRQGMDGSNFAGEKVLETISMGEERKSWKAKPIDLMLLGALKSKTLFVLELIGGVAVLINLLPDPDEKNFDRFFDIIFRLGAGPSMLIGIALLIVLATLCGMIGSLVRYYGFKVLDNGEAVKIEYGLLDRKTYTIPKKKISGFYYEQSALMRLCKVGSLNLMAVGYGAGTDESSSEEALLFPMLRADDVQMNIGMVLPEMAEGEPYQKPERKAFHYFFFRFSLIFSLFCLGGSLFLPKVDDFFDNCWMVAAILVALSLGAAVLDYLTTGIYGNERHFSLTAGGMKKITVFIKTSMIESMESGGSILKRKRGIANISIGCIAPMGQNMQSVDNLPVETYEKLKEFLLY